MAHPREVAELLYAAGCSDEVVAAGVLHGTVELTRADLAEITERFGTRIAALVAAVTENDSIRSYGRRKAALRDQAISGGGDAAVLFAADKVSKAREFRAQLAAVTQGGRRARGG
jgi:(p)ppGpp synthase/HD superfamily hydrolase